jgi:hypothetical protein
MGSPPPFPRFGLWATTDRGELYPNPASALFSLALALTSS